MTRISLSLAMLSLCVVAATAFATPLNYTRINVSSNLPSSYITNQDIQQGTTTTITYASNQAVVLDLPASIAAMNGGTTCKYGYQRVSVVGFYSSCGRVLCTFGNGAPQQQVSACVADRYNTSSMHNSMTLDSSTDSITFTADAVTVSY